MPELDEAELRRQALTALNGLKSAGIDWVPKGERLPRLIARVRRSKRRPPHRCTFSPALRRRSPHSQICPKEKAALA